MSFFENNLSALLKKNHILVKLLNKAERDTGDVDIITTDSGYPTARWNGIYVHSKYDPKREAQVLLQRENITSPSAVISYGLGLGYLVEYFVESFPHVPLLVVEPDIPFFKKALTARDMRTIFRSRNVHFHIGYDAEDVTGFLDCVPISNLRIIKLRSVYQRNEEFYRKVDTMVQAYVSRKTINVNTLNRFGKLWIRNLLKNLDSIQTYPGVSYLENSFAGISSLVISAGPSLDQILPFLTQLKERMLLIAVDTAINPCLNHGVKPDFLVVVDPQYWNTRHLDRVHLSETHIVFEPSTHPRIKEFIRMGAFITSSYFPLGEYFESVLGKKGKLGAGGSVSTAAWDFARFIGSAPIYLAGLDLGFPHRRTHCHGTYFETLWYQQAQRYNPVERQSFQALRDAHPFPTHSNTSQEVLTDKRMIIYKWWFEEQMNIHSAVTTYNLSKNGIRIKGMPFLDAKNLLELPERRRCIEELKNSINDYTQSTGEAEASDKRRCLRQALATLLQELAVIESCAQEGMQLTDMLAKALEKHQDAGEIIQKLNKVDCQLLKISSRNIAGFLLQPIIQETVANQNRCHTVQQVISTSKDIYTQLMESTSFHQKSILNSFKVMGKKAESNINKQNKAT